MKERAMAERRIRVGVIGAGTFAEQCHVPGVQAHPRAEVAALCARNRQRAAAMAARLGVPEVITDYRELLARPDIDAVTIVAPDSLHMEIAVAASQAGKHVLCEKPLAQNAEEARRMTEEAARSGLIAMVAFTFRYMRALPELRRLVREGVIGTPFYAALQVHWGEVIRPGAPIGWRQDLASCSGGVWADGAAHLFDVLAFALAPVQEVCAQMVVVPRPGGSPQPTNVDLATCLARLHLEGERTSGYADREPGTVQVSILTSRVDRPHETPDEFQVLGTAGALSMPLTRGQREHLHLLRPGGASWEPLPLPPDALTETPHALTRMMGAFVDAILRGHLDPDHDPGFAAGLHTQLALDAGLRSARNGTWERVPETT
jgi:predicted dehydrogenase